MHPILAARSRLGLYLLGWSPLALLVVAFWRFVGGAAWGEALGVGLPLVFVYSYLCLAAWYVCRALPLRPLGSPRPLRLFAAHLLAALLSSAVWVLLGWGWAGLVGELPALSGAGERFAGQAPQVFALGVPVYLASAAVHYLILALETSREAELRALKAQLDPHFLFNSLNAVAALAGNDPAGARRMAILLAEFLRRSLRLGERRAIPLAEELAHAASYLAVERVRFGDRLAVEESVDEESRGCLVPPLLLQPLVENAVRHGIAQLLDGGVLRIEARRDRGGGGDRLLLAVENPCDPDHAPVRGEGVGLANVAARLGAHGRLSVRTPPGAFRVEIELPATGGDGA